MTLTGAGGVGKTRMALEVARDVQRAFHDGTWFVELAALQDAALVADAVADALGVIKHTTRSPLLQLQRHLENKHLLVILDNCEHLSDSCAQLVSALLRTSPNLHILVTSRHSLGVFGEQIFTVPPMSTPSSATDLDASSLDRFDSVALLCARASDCGSGFVVTDENSRLVARLCERLDGIPLAIELAAARLRTLTVADVLERLDRRFQLLTAGDSSALPRHQTLQALIDWSHALCSTSEQRLWAQLSVFAGSFDLAAVETVCDGPDFAADELVDLVDALVRKSILIAEPGRDRKRYRLLETVREHGAARLATADRDRLEEAHREYFCAVAQRSLAEWCGPEQADWLVRLREDFANLRSALDSYLESGFVNEACALASALQWYWIAGGNIGEGRRWLGEALRIADARPASLAQGRAMWVDAYLALLRGELADAQSRLDQVEHLDRGFQMPAGAVAQLRGMAALFHGDLVRARGHYENALADYEERDDGVAALYMLFQLAVVYVFAGNHDKAAALCELSIRLSGRYGDRWGASYTLWALALNKWTVGDYRGAEQLARESLKVKQEYGDHLGVAHMVEMLSWIAVSDRRFEDGARLQGEANAVWDSLGTSMGRFGRHLAECHLSTEASLRQALGVRVADSLIGAGNQIPGGALALGTDRPPDAAEPAVPARLTPREIEVATLVARGMTNREIGVQLVLSSRTIDSHVQHILTKLGFNGRSQIAGWVVGQQKLDAV
ncbi:helix-turn-helix transcriptional regulator [Mycobacterium vicinigordonae]|nr:LuxR C-terminal-related transcriptional regulator [Mycobacterium vicinigordonae]